MLLLWRSIKGHPNLTIQREQQAPAVCLMLEAQAAVVDVSGDLPAAPLELPQPHALNPDWVLFEELLQRCACVLVSHGDTSVGRRYTV